MITVRTQKRHKCPFKHSTSIYVEDGVQSRRSLLQICNMHLDPGFVMVSLGVQSFSLCLISFIAAPVCELAENFVAHTKH